MNSSPFPTPSPSTAHIEERTLEILSVAEAASLFNIPKPTLYQHLRTGMLPGIRIGGRWRVDKKEIAKMIGLELGKKEDSTPPVRSRIAQLQEENAQLRGILCEQQLKLNRLRQAASSNHKGGGSQIFVSSLALSPGTQRITKPWERCHRTYGNPKPPRKEEPEGSSNGGHG